MPNAFHAEMDMRTILESQEIEKSSSRMAAAKNFALAESDRFRQLANKIPNQEKKRFNGTVKNSRMKPNAKS